MDTTSDLLERDELLALLLDEEGFEAPAGPIVFRPATGPVPLSFAQQRLWFLQQLAPESASYNVAVAVRMAGALDADALRRTLQEIVRRHRVLRTRVAAEDGVAAVSIAPAEAVELPVVEGDAAGLPALLAARTRLPFDLENGSPVRFALVRLGEREHVLHAAAHHIVCDGWSMGVLAAEVGAIYPAFAAGLPSPLAEPPVQFGDFAAWEREQLGGGWRDGLMAFWREYLEGAPPALELPTDFARPAVQSFRGASLARTLPRGAWEAVQALGRAHGCTPFMAMAALYATLLHRWSGEDEVVMGTPVAGRDHPDLQEAIGPFLNTVPVRVRMGGDPGFGELLERVREASLSAFAHGDLPLDAIVEEVRPERTPGRQPLFQTLFVLQNAPAPLPRLDGLELERLPQESHSAKFDLSLKVEETDDGARMELEYASDLFGDGTVRRMLAHLAALAVAVAADPARPLSALPLMDAAEREATLALAGEGRAADAACFHHLFEARAAATPDAPALVSGADALTYAELDGRANQLAHYLRSMGVEPEVPVGISLERGVEMVVAMLGVLKAGGAYLPLDPALPPERAARMLNDAGAPVLLTEADKLATVPLTFLGTVLPVDAARDEIAAESAERCDGGATPDDAAYLVYTSGSTGEPKGVVVTHASVAGYLAAATERLGLDACGSFAHVSTFGADLGNTVLFPALAGGGTLHVLTAEQAADPDAFAEAVAAHGIDCIKLTPSHLRMLLAGSDPARALPRVLVMGGELLPASLVDEVRRLRPECRVFNHYGPTEATVGVAAGEVDADTGGRPAPVGRPLANSRVYVLDRHLAPAPVGVPGEVYLGGSGVARGYHGRPEATAERFVHDPFTGARMYRTGDRARWRADGRLEILGRVDRQVKVRGHRVEPGETEAVLMRQPGVREAVVVPAPVPDGGVRLAAYVVAAPGADAAELRAAVRRELPDAFVPSFIVLLDRIPLTPNGKVDARALPSPESAVGATVETGTLTPTAERVAEIWKEVLGIASVGMHENFFDLGGHSVLAIQVMARVQKAFRVEVPLIGLFEMPTVAELARHLDTARDLAPRSAPEIVALPRDGSEPLPLSFGQQRLWFLQELDPDSSAYNMTGVLRARGRLDVAALEASFTEIVRRHEVLRTVYHKVDGRPAQRILDPAPVCAALVDLRGEPDETRDEQAREILTREARRPIDIENGPVLRVLLVRTGDEEHSLLIAIHHVAGDGWSVGHVMRELAALYEGLAAGRAVVLPEPPVQYADFAAWQRRWLEGGVLEAQMEYWRGRLTPTPPVLELPADRPRPPRQSHRGGEVRAFLTPRTAARLHEVAREQGVTMFMLLLAGFQALLHRYTGEADLAVGTPVAGRNRRELEEVMGFFVNTLVVRTDLAGDPTFAALLPRVRESALGAYAHQDVPFEYLVEELRVERDLGRTPLFQTMFVWHNIPSPVFELPGLVLVPQGVPSGTAKFDLTLSMQEWKDGGMLASLEYASDLFDEATAHRMAGHLVTLLEAVAADVHQPLSRIPILPQTERGRLLEEWNDTARETPAGGIAELFAAQAARTPGAVAVSCGPERLTYAELDERSGRLAAALAAEGVGPESLVALLAERGIGLLVQVLAVWKAGGAYLPLDPRHPPARHAQVLERGGALLALAGGEHAEALAQACAIHPNPPRVRCARELEARGGTVPSASYDAGRLAYVIFTSGSTGEPKGAMLEHGGMLNHLLAKVETLELGADDVVAQNASQCFDISVWQLVSPLLVGGRVEIFPDEIAHDPFRLLGEVRERGVTVLEVVPSLLGALLDAESEPAELPLRWMIPTGEALSPELAARWLARYPELPMVNAYGPTECSDDVTQHVITRAPEGARVPIGRPLRNTRLYVLDAAMQPVPTGVTGELYVGGAGVGRGYVNDPARTETVFLTDPFGGGRLYRTGDRGRWLADGTLDFIGRADEQVKLRGYRVEPGEIEAVLRQCPGVADALVMLRQGASGEPLLAAYLVGDAVPAALREWVGARLPEYMVPGAFVPLDAFPLTPNGKTDRAALPAPGAESMVGGRERVAPRNLLEHQLTEIWAEVLGVPEVGITDNYFELGGHSILAVRLMAMVQDRMGRELPLSSLFQGPTVEHQAHLLRERPDPALWSPLVRITAGQEGRLPLFAVHPTGGDVLCYHHLARLLGPEQPFYALQARGLDGRSEPLRSIQEMATEYLRAVRTVQPHGPYQLAGWSFGGVVAYEMAQQLRAAGEEVALVGILDSLAPVAAADFGEREELGRSQWAHWFGVLAAEFQRVLGHDVTLAFDELCGLEPEAQLERFLDRLGSVEFLPPGGGRSLARGFWRIHEANSVALWNYSRVATPYPGTLTLLRCEEDLLLQDSWARDLHDNRDHGWHRLAQGELRVLFVPGDHNTMMSPPFVDGVAQGLGACLCAPQTATAEG